MSGSPSASEATGSCWWRRGPVCTLLADLITDELGRLRPGLSPPRLDEDTVLRNAAGPSLGLDLDSLELLDLTTSVELRFGPGSDGAADPTASPRSLPGAALPGAAILGDALLAGVRLGDWADAVLAARAWDDGRIAFLTSGSTGAPIRAEHGMPALRCELAHWAGLLGDRRRVLRAVPLHHIYGFLFGFMLPARLGVEVVDVRGLLPADVLRRASPGDLIVGHPGLFALATRGAVRTCDDLVALVSTAPCPDSVWSGLRSAGVERVLEIYGASECGGMGARWSEAAPFELLPWWRRGDRALRRADGLGGDCAVPDALEWLDGGGFRLLGRRDHAIQVGGRNVYPAQVRALLLEHVGVAEAAVRGFTVGSEQRLKAFVVPAADEMDEASLRLELLDWLAARLPPWARPRRIDVGAELPTTATGKLRDW